MLFRSVDDGLLTKAKTLAAKERTSLARLIEQGLTLRLSTQVQPSNWQRSPLPVYAGKRGLRATVDDALTHRALLDAADDTE